ncbi:polysaccharide pyruvyl transferase family protein [Rathayibacter sp. VKM Ac-2835]|uniref:polysaccharide pyruvyl transferase family protein n=1 Tax=Rathayibacter sp. VKM Ac-2835 TaxID=2739043 RepID=UPI001564E567|nr:polysaccharide pyruvyl transferase family protein [Rathayibacter sp. VKM Ac-2835]NRG39809.1 polysaccharide pyruvyl transferase family protein [Rathayibacter sp. VKM Ac-2835]
MKIFVPVVGQYENIGDIVLRRELVEWLSGMGEMHAYVGASPASYDEALDLPADVITYRSVGGWARELGSCLRRGECVAYIYKPGEIQLTWRGLKEHIGLLPLVVATRLRGGLVIRVGAGSRNFDRWPTAVFRSTLALSHYTMWRDVRTADRLGHGGVMPDLGFGQVGSEHAASTERTRLTVTMRGDRVPPSRQWRQAIARIAEERGLRLTVVTQVERDEPLMAELAGEWDADYVAWGSRSHKVQEAAVRRAFAESALVVSDRLHALIVAVAEGAAVASMADTPTDKIERHFAAAGIPIVVFDAKGRSTDAIADALRSVDTDASQQSALQGAVDQLAVVRTAVRTLLEARA